MSDAKKFSLFENITLGNACTSPNCPQSQAQVEIKGKGYPLQGILKNDVTQIWELRDRLKGLKLRRSGRQICNRTQW